MKLKGNCQTTAMGILPHEEIEGALELSLSMDIPFWPQLPKTSFYEDMYAQISERFPGIILDQKNKSISFSLSKFYNEIDQLLENWDNEKYFQMSEEYSAYFHRFLEQDLSAYGYIRGQTIGPISYGLKIMDEDKKPMIYHQEVREVIFDFIAKKIQAQYNQMKHIHPRPFVWVDEPGLQMIFMAMTGYASNNALNDYKEFLTKFEGPKGVHLCGNPDWSFLLQLDLNILSIDTLAWGHIFTRYKNEIKSFLDKGGIISWGITPTLKEEYDLEDFNSIVNKLESMWNYLEQSGVSRKQILSQAWLAPARCCLINNDGVKTVENSYRLLNQVADHFKEQV
ncbi:MAG: hypothetical protein APF76_01860 [Desulfitibacter sp. BRH_c19]|nr:MAG: hypothetical protein APF76_01860 [Desulfitibacter sp. BRH_c19]